MTTVIDVAREAGVSLATVSRVLNGTATVSPQMRERVQTAVQLLGFRPNPMAQGLRKGQAASVALLVGDIAQRHFAELTLRVQASLEERGLDLLLFNLGHSESRLADFLDDAVSLARPIVSASCVCSSTLTSSDARTTIDGPSSAKRRLDPMLTVSLSEAVSPSLSVIDADAVRVMRPSAIAISWSANGEALAVGSSASG